ncbi:MAG: hypothetical protein AMXMBFR57_30770 [Acidimicrobiia bacterium]|jgi:hypothetical protein
MTDYRRIAVSALFVAFLVATNQEPAAAFSSYDWCYNSCDSGAACSLECENDGGGTTTCGDYDGGAGNGWCDGDTCGDICSPHTPAWYECYDDNVFTDCGTYGDAAACDDGICAINEVEDCDSCPEDCGACPPFNCDDNFCDAEAGETARNCPSDCDDLPGQTCNDSVCEPGEGPECEECVTPIEYCGWEYGCPMGWECVGNQCVHQDYIGSFPTCPTGSCSSGSVCKAVRNLMTGGTTPVCIPWYWDLN